MGIILDLFIEILTAYLKALEKKNKKLLTIFYSGVFLFIFSATVIVLGNIIYPAKNHKDENLIIVIISVVLLMISLGLLLIPALFYSNLDKEKKLELVIEQEKKVAEHPNEPKLAWDLARIKLESYLNRNISQVKAIFSLSVFVMIVGFGLIIYGAVKVFDDPKNLNGSIVVAVAGLIVNFIGATFLIVYKSVMEQAKDFVNVLERINAVGMSVQIIETIKDSHLQLKEETKAELSKKLIDLYTEKK